MSCEERPYTVPARKLMDICKAYRQRSGLNYTGWAKAYPLGRHALVCLRLPSGMNFKLSKNMQGDWRFLFLKTVCVDLDWSHRLCSMANQDVALLLNGMLLEWLMASYVVVSTVWYIGCRQRLKTHKWVGDLTQVYCAPKGVLELNRPITMTRMNWLSLL